MLEKRPITRDNLRALLMLKLRPDQENLVASNPVTIAQAAYEPNSVVFGLWDGEQAVGLFAMTDLPKHPDGVKTGDVPDAPVLWRLMISADNQGRGYGRAAMELVKQVAREWGYRKLASSVVDAPNSNMGFYEAMGFSQTGGTVDGELVIVTDI